MIAKDSELRELYETPAYGVVEAAKYLRVPYQTLRYWLTGFHRIPPLIQMAQEDPPRLSFLNVLECHMLSAMRSVYNLRVPRVRRALVSLKKHFPSRHPLIDRVFQTDGVHVFTEEFGRLIVLSQDGQFAMKSVLELHLQRIECDPTGLFRFFPFVMTRRPDEPKSILIDPLVGFGKPVIAGTAISTSVIATRFKARESIRELGEEYGRPEREIEEAIRWEEATELAA